jgi:hypothetical protein
MAGLLGFDTSTRLLNWCAARSLKRSAINGLTSVIESKNGTWKKDFHVPFY